MFFIFILIFLIFLVAAIWKSKLQIKVYNLDISTEREERIKRNFEIYLSIVIFNKIEIFKTDIKKLKNKKINLGSVIERAQKLQQRDSKQALLKDLLVSLKNFEFEIKKANLNLEFGTEDAATTAILIGVISSVLGIILRNQKFEIIPIYKDKNILNLKLNCIFRVNLIHYIYKTILKGRERNERKSSDRRAYAYSHEQHT